jgi:hypothetical protein
MEIGINFLPSGMEGKKAGNYGIRRLTIVFLWIAGACEYFAHRAAGKKVEVFERFAVQ